MRRLQALGRRVIVLVDRPPVKTGKFHLPTVSQRPPSTGTVVSLGNEASKEQPALGAGARVFFRPYQGQDIQFDGHLFRQLDISEVWALVGSAAVDPVEAGA